MRGLAIGRSIAEVIEESRPKVRQSHPVSLTPVSYRLISVTRDQIEVTTFGDATAQYIASPWATVEMTLWEQPTSPIALDAVISGVRYIGSVTIDELDVV